MISLTSQIQAVLDSLGIQLDAQSFQNLITHLRIDRLTWTQKTALAVALGVGVQWLQKAARERQAARQALQAAS
jgi:hypothetical protein